MEVKYGAIDNDDSLFHCYYLIKFYPYPYTLQSDLVIDEKVIYYGEMVYEGNYFFAINRILIIMFYK